LAENVKIHIKNCPIIKKNSFVVIQKRKKRQGSYDYRLTKLNEKVFP